MVERGADRCRRVRGADRRRGGGRRGRGRRAARAGRRRPRHLQAVRRPPAPQPRAGPTSDRGARPPAAAGRDPVVRRALRRQRAGIGVLRARGLHRGTSRPEPGRRSSARRGVARPGPARSECAGRVPSHAATTSDGQRAATCSSVCTRVATSNAVPVIISSSAPVRSTSAASSLDRSVRGRRDLGPGDAGEEVGGRHRVEGGELAGGVLGRHDRPQRTAGPQ